jgi:SAM-dependent methyltransferase
VADETRGSPWDERFARGDWPEEPEGPFAAVVQDLLPGRALDLGCGPGRHAIWLARRGWSVVGIDESAVGLDVARRRAEAAGVTLELHQADIATWSPPADGFDLVILANIHPAPADRPSLFAHAAAAVAPGGHLLVLGHHLDELGHQGPPDPARLYTPERVRDALPNSLLIERLERVEAEERDGRRAAHVVALARRPPGSSTAPTPPAG